MIPVFLVAIVQERTIFAGIILVVSGITDVLDGYLARTFKWTTPLGSLLDPLADKLTQAAVSISFIFVVKQFSELFWIFIVKDLLMILASAYAYFKKIFITEALWFGKAATFLFYATMILILLVPNLSANTKFVMLSISAVSAIFACIMYLRFFLKVAIPAFKKNQGV